MPDDSHPHEEQPSGLSWLAIQRPISVIVGIVLVVLFGILSVVDLPIQLTPDIATPTISVSTVWPGCTLPTVTRALQAVSAAMGSVAAWAKP